MGDNYLHSDLTGQIINSFYTVYNSLGYGFMEKVSKNAFYEFSGNVARSASMRNAHMKSEEIAEVVE